MNRLRTDRGEMNFLKVLLVLAIAGGGYVAYARGGLVLEHMDVKTAVRLGANRAYARRNPEVVKEAIVTGVRDAKMVNEEIGADGTVIKRPVEFTDENMDIRLEGDPNPSVTIRVTYDRSWVWPLTKKVGRTKYTFTHTEDLRAIKY